MTTLPLRTAATGNALVGCLLAGALALLAQADAVAQTTSSSVLADPQAAWQPQQQQRFSLSLQTQPVPPQWSFQPRGGVHELQSQPAQPASLNLDFRRKSQHQQAKDLLRVQLSADSVLNFRPRGGGLTVTYRAQF